MSEHSKSNPLVCTLAWRDFPVIATALAVVACFGEALLQKYFAPGRGFQIALGLGQAVPVGLLVRYFVVRSRKSREEISRRADPVR
ncbi:MAG TPA: hypothetical protein VJU77_04495 [Chthoniobacterales bacterium]|nr:hypothetical protein [Chthoniobacterales bacterium]